MKKIHYAEIVYTGFDPAFEDLIILGAEKNKLNLLSITLTSVIVQSIILIQGKCSKRTFQTRLSKLEADARQYKRSGKPKEFNIWTY